MEKLKRERRWVAVAFVLCLMLGMGVFFVPLWLDAVWHMYPLWIGLLCIYGGMGFTALSGSYLAARIGWIESDMVSLDSEGSEGV